MLKPLLIQAAMTTTLLAPPTSTPTTISVVAANVAGGVRVTVTVEGQNGRTIDLQRSGDLTGWQTIATHKLKNAPFIYTAETQDSRQFFRAVEQ